MSSSKFSDEFKREAVAQITERGYIEMFYNPKRKHARNGMLSPLQFERKQKLRLEGVYETRGYSQSYSA